MDCCLQLASHNCFLYISLVDSCFFTILRIYRLNFTLQQIPIWVANTLPWAPEVFLACGGNFRCWPKADTSSVQIPICPSLTKTYFSLRKTYFRQNIDYKQYSPKLYFPFVYLICLLHMLSLTFLFFIIHFYFSMQFLWAWISHGTEPVGVTFSQYSPASKKEPADSRPNFYSWANGAFFCQHTKDQCVILKQTHFVVATLNTLSDKSNVNF